MATHSSILVWRIPWTEKPDGLEKRDTSEWLTHQKSRRNGGWSIIHQPWPAKLHVTPVPRKRSIWNPVVLHCSWIWICEFSSSLQRVCNHPDQHPGAFRSFIDMCGASLCCPTSRTPAGWTKIMPWLLGLAPRPETSVFLPAYLVPLNFCAFVGDFMFILFFY